MKKIQKGFTLIELLIVIAIIGILAGVILVSTNSARSKAKIASWKATVRSTHAPAVMCCSSATTANFLSATVATAMCAGGETWPTAAALGAAASNITINTNCSTVSSNFQYTIVPTITDISASCTNAVCDQTGCRYTPASGQTC